LFPEGVLVFPIKTNINERGFFAELYRQDWFHPDEIVQVNISESKPGTVHAWHRHNRGQIDYMVCIQGEINIMIKQKWEDSLTKILNSALTPVLVRIPGEYWHGYKVISSRPARVLYLVTNLYDYENPDEERREFTE
jgi:dTDP-4-dehydrorhamnose 3,5-epimerase